MNSPVVVGLGGSRRAGSLSLVALRRALSIAESGGARAELLDLAELDLPMFTPGAVDRDHPAVARLYESVSAAQAVIVSSPVYQECPSGAVRNALDHLHDLTDDPQGLRGRRAGLIAVSGGGGTASCLAVLHASCVSLGALVSRTRVGLTSAVLDATGVIYDPIPDERLESMVLDLLAGVPALT